MNLNIITKQIGEMGYEYADAQARVCQDIVLKAIASSSLSRNVTIKGGVVSVSGRSAILFTPAELRVIERYGDYDRNTTRGKLDILLDRFKDDATKESARAVIEKLGRISYKSYADLYSVRQR